MKIRPVLVSCLSTVLAVVLLRSAASACTPPPEVTPYALPRPTSSLISTATSIHIVSYHRPQWVEVTAGGAVVKTDGVELVSDMYLKNARGKLWRVQGLAEQYFLPFSSEIVVTTSSFDGKSKQELTRFTTAAGYDKKHGTAPVLHSIKLWRVHYPVELLNSGECIFAEYRGLISLDYDPAVIPDTPDESVIYTLSLRPKTGGLREQISFTGAQLLKGSTATKPPHVPNFPDWPTDLDPTREYCASIVASGYGDLARLPLTSNKVCAKVTPFEYGAKQDGASDGPSADGPAPADLGPGDPGVDVGSGVSSDRGSGCSFDPTGERSPWSLVVLLLLAIPPTRTTAGAARRRGVSSYRDASRAACTSCSSTARPRSSNIV